MLHGRQRGGTRRTIRRSQDDGDGTQMGGVISPLGRWQIWHIQEVGDGCGMDVAMGGGAARGGKIIEILGGIAVVYHHPKAKYINILAAPSSTPLNIGMDFRIMEQGGSHTWSAGGDCDMSR